MQVETSDPTIKEAWQEVLNGKDKDSADWAIFTYAKGSDTKLKVDRKGTGGVDELRDNLRDGVVQYAFLKLPVLSHGTYFNKHIFIFFVGEGVTLGTKRAQIMRHSQQFADEIHSFNVFLNLTEDKQVTEAYIVERLKMADQPTRE
jgi:hypothetical protein